jgi:hypothetical protein
MRWKKENSHIFPKWNHFFNKFEQSRNKGGASGALAPGAVNVGAKNE